MKRRAVEQAHGPIKKRKVPKRERVQAINLGPGRPSAIFVPEKKWVDTSNYAVPILSGTAAANHNILLNGLVPGTRSYNRVGNRIQITDIHVKVSLHPVTPVPTSVPEDIVFMVIYDNEGGSLPALGALLTSTDLNGAGTSTPISHFNLTESKRYKILKRKVVPLRICGTATGALPCNGAAFQANQDDLIWSWHIKSNILTQYNAGASGGVGDIANGSIIFCWWTSLGVGLPVSNFDCETRIRYYD